MKSLFKFSAIFLPILAQAEEPLTGIGWQKTEWADKIANAYDFFAPENWDNGVVNGLFGIGLGTAKTTQYIKFTQDYSGSMSFTHSCDAYLTFVSDGTRDATWYITGDLNGNASITKGSVTFGSSDANRKVNVDLGGVARKFTLKGTAGYAFCNAIQNGDLDVFAQPVMTLRYDKATIDGDVTFAGAKLQFDSSHTDCSGTMRTKNLKFVGNELELKGSNADVVDTVGGDLTISGESGALKLVTVLAPTKSSVLKADKLVLENHPFVGFRGHNLGQQSPGVAGANILFKTTPELVGGLIPNAVAAANYDGSSGNASILGYSYKTSLATYDTEKGVRPLDLETEYVKSIDAVVSGHENLLVPHGETVTIDGEKTVNALLLQGGDSKVAATLAKGDDEAKLKVLSGQVVLGYTRNANIKMNLPISFGEIEGCISYASGKTSTWNAPISGSMGVTFGWFSCDVADGNGLTINSDCDYTGDTYVNGAVVVGVNNKVLPMGARQGDVYVRGALGFNGSSSGGVKVTPTINGLYGDGIIKRKTYHIDLTFGDNNSNGDFTGTVQDFSSLTKVGSGTQRLAGAISIPTAQVARRDAIYVKEGTLILDGTVSDLPVNVAAGAKLGGSGIIKTSVAFADGAKLLAKVEGKTLAVPLTVAAASGTAIVEADGLWKGEACVLKAAEGATLEGLTFKRGANVGKLTLSADKTELYATPKAKGFSIVVM